LAAERCRSRLGLPGDVTAQAPPALFRCVGTLTAATAGIRPLLQTTVYEHPTDLQKGPIPRLAKSCRAEGHPASLRGVDHGCGGELRSDEGHQSQGITARSGRSDSQQPHRAVTPYDIQKHALDQAHDCESAQQKADRAAAPGRSMGAGIRPAVHPTPGTGLRWLWRLAGPAPRNPRPAENPGRARTAHLERDDRGSASRICSGSMRLTYRIPSIRWTFGIPSALNDRLLWYTVY
jgi:hypothetical protein